MKKIVTSDDFFLFVLNNVLLLLSVSTYMDMLPIARQ